MQPCHYNLVVYSCCLLKLQRFVFLFCFINQIYNNRVSACLYEHPNSFEYILRVRIFLHIKIETMKIFGNIQHYLLMLGISPTESYSISWKIAMGFILFGLNILLNVMLSFSMENPVLMDYLNTFNRILTMVAMCISLAVVTSQKLKLFRVIKDIEKLVNKSMIDHLFAQ